MKTCIPNRTDLSIRLALALKKVPKSDREAFAHKDWKISETAQQSIAALLTDELACYDFTLKPVAAPNTHQGHAASGGVQEERKNRGRD